MRSFERVKALITGRRYVETFIVSPLFQRDPFAKRIDHGVNTIDWRLDLDQPLSCKLGGFGFETVKTMSALHIYLHLFGFPLSEEHPL